MTSSKNREIHVFDNGVRVFKHQLNAGLQRRLTNINLAEPKQEEWFISLLNRLGADSVFVDVGAAYGYYSILARSVKPELEVHAFEPVELHRTFLRENLALNRMTDQDIVVHREAVSSYAGSSTIELHSYKSLLTHARGPYALDANLTILLKNTLRTLQRRIRVAFKAKRSSRIPIAQAERVDVMTTTLDAFITALGRPIDLVKVDVQGFEMEVLEGARSTMRSHIRAWIIGTHSNIIHAACLRELKSAGYTILYQNESPKYQSDGFVVATQIP